MESVWGVGVGRAFQLAHFPVEGQEIVGQQCVERVEFGVELRVQVANLASSVSMRLLSRHHIAPRAARTARNGASSVQSMGRAYTGGGRVARRRPAACPSDINAVMGEGAAVVRQFEIFWPVKTMVYRAN